MSGFVQRSIRLSEEKRDSLERLSKEKNTSTQKLIDDAINKYLVEEGSKKAVKDDELDRLINEASVLPKDKKSLAIESIKAILRLARI